MRLAEIWVPDVRSDEFRVAAHNQSAAVAQSRHAREDQAIIGSNSDWPAA
ncbi:MAG: antitoxin MazE-like protein [Anderseniella sp.]|jgi:hypothetical protein|nr:antitoxin MazE-like protein [Anderseniella sp.]